MWTSFSDESLNLVPHQVHLWFVDKKNHKDRLTSYWSILNELEKEKATKYRFEKDRDCSIIARGVIRMLLGNYLKIHPKDVKLKLGEFGKPFLNELSDIQFNVSHSAETIVLAFIKKDKIGVDVEHTKRNIEVNTIAKQFFSKEEITALFSLDEKFQKQAFYNCWTRKEAFIKALGSGLSFPLDEFVVSLDSTKNAQLLETKWNLKEKENWTLKSFEPAKNYIGAFSVKGKVTDVQYWKYQ